MYNEDVRFLFSLNPYRLDRIDAASMNSQTACGHSFIVRVWLEETSEESGRAVWRGRITHVPSHEKRYFQDMDDLFSFIQRYISGWEGGSDLDHFAQNYTPE
jgi:hypothetical protein